MKNSRKRNAFTLIEIMVVIIILGLLAAFVIPNITGKSEEAKQKLVCVQMKSLSEGLKMFKIDNGSYPTTEEGIAALITNPSSDTYPSYSKNGYLEGKNLPKDPWNHPYIYLNDGTTFDLVSLGADGKEGGSDDGKDQKLSECR
ncbi:type II secretion system major pseudopilin GspG [Sulfuricurvum sp.]|uniref:type II secretion system major pseudopilin GspG n=1 Tax=Sulfuricurvum sp. TaxID=2025608 RepID=UPI002615E82F|nr:type II secretion system major pseudopilin GspG [Sulfuricurvum sp.]MDD2266733.1 type II secretion system major pseudopilin GspG [Sulfuricurvum sp.]MDD2783901.1 type II secretion system major pseudopilin GspG [Sulfuricurvum sp.]